MDCRIMWKKTLPWVFFRQKKDIPKKACTSGTLFYSFSILFLFFFYSFSILFYSILFPIND